MAFRTQLTRRIPIQTRTKYYEQTRFENMKFHDRGLQITIKYIYSENEIGDYFPDTSQENIGHHRRGISEKTMVIP